jgi:hypothetical protein
VPLLAGYEHEHPVEQVPLPPETLIHFCNSARHCHVHDPVQGCSVVVVVVVDDVLLVVVDDVLLVVVDDVVVPVLVVVVVVGGAVLVVLVVVLVVLVDVLLVVDDELLELVVVDELDELVVVVEPPSSWQNVLPISPISVPLYAGGPEHSQPTPHSSERNTHVEPFH